MNRIMHKLISIGILGVVVAPCAWGIMSQTMAAAIDKNRDGEITPEEYAAFYDLDFSRRDRGDDGILTPRELTNQNLFRLGDRNKDGQLTRKEFQGIYTPRFARFDVNGDGLIAGDEIEHVPGKRNRLITHHVVPIKRHQRI